jgi:hypothetical protein
MTMHVVARAGCGSFAARGMQCASLFEGRQAGAHIELPVFGGGESLFPLSR